MEKIWQTLPLLGSPDYIVEPIGVVGSSGITGWDPIGVP
jgi:hypothetical protein